MRGLRRGVMLLGTGGVLAGASPAPAADNSQAMAQHMRLMEAGNPGMMQMMERMAAGNPGMDAMMQAPPFDQMPNTNHP